ncbi:MAG: translation initiation factor IF-2 [Phycisphaerales bacterium]|nr:translation initiation factor IF-2 [Phycisphaerales bacterium]
MAKVRINDLAKELGVHSKDIIAKCLAEDVPADVVKSGMSTIPVGLAQSVREWFADAASAQGGTATAVETREHPKVEELKKAPVKRKGATKKGGEGDDSNGGGAEGVEAPETPEVEKPAPATATPAPVAKITPPAPAKPAAPAPVTAPTTAASPVVAPSAPKKVEPARGPAVGSETPLVEFVEHAKAHKIDPNDPPASPMRPAASMPTPPTMPPASLSPKVIAPAATTTATTPSAGAPSGSTASAPAASTTASPAKPDQGAAGGPGGAASTGTGGGSGGGASGPGGTPGGPARPVSRGPIRPPVMNVPTRPTVVAPAGQKLEVKQTVKLAGPRVVRIEAPEPVSAPRPRPMGPGGPGGPRTGGGGGGGRGVIGGGAGDDASARRNKRRAPGGAPEGATARRRPAASATDDMPLGTGFSEQDLAEREERLARASGLLKQRRREAKIKAEARGVSLDDDMLEGKVQIQAPFTIKDLSAASGVKAADILKRLFMQGVMATINSGIDPAKAQEIMIDFDLELEIIEAKTAEQKVEAQFTDRKKLDERPRSSVVTIMGHVDHGKTSLLDAIRKTNVAAGEAGGITQKTSAFKVAVDVGGETKHVVFIDTPGHEAFTEMRARGATVTDVVVLVVGAPEGVMPQTIESINHARAAKVPIVVALNKIDSPQATENQIQKVYGQLAEQNLNPVQWGGQTEVIHTSATKGTGIKELLEILDLQAEVLQLKADFKGNARGRVVEATRDEGRGPIATVLVQDGELKVGDFIVVGRAFGRVRDITDDQGKKIKSAGPSTPVQISGFDEVPDAGDAFFVSETLKQAEEAADQRRTRDRQEALHQPKVTLDSLFSQMKDAKLKEILIVLKADVQGSVDVIAHQIEKLSSSEVKVRVLHSAVGGITESDVILADASKAVIVGFNVIPTGKARSMADQKGVEVRTYQVIYDIVDDVKKAASGMLEPEIRQEILGHAEVRQVFKVSKVGTIAGCYITDGQVQRDALIRVTRNGIVIEQDRVLEQLKRFKDDAKDVKAGMECGMKIVGYDDIKQGDVLECYKKVEIKRTL